MTRRLSSLWPMLGVWVCAAGVVASEAGPTPREPLRLPLGKPRIELHKARRELLLYSGDRLVRVYRVGLGFEPVAPKRRQGDGATPEGSYRVCVKNPHSRYTLSLGLDYPNPADAAAAEGRLREGDRWRIEEAHRRGACPPWDTPLGGEIFLHGRGAGSDWTAGCAALDDADIEELYAATPLGTPVRILP